MDEHQRPNLTMNRRILQRIFDEVHRTPDFEIGGRFFGRLDDENARVDDFIPTGPEPDSVSAVELLPDRRYQLWTLDQLRVIDDELQLFGTWHSHIPNGMERFSNQDFRAYQGRMEPPYPYGGMICGLIHQMPNTVEQVREHLNVAWFPANAGFGVHSFYEPKEISWHEDKIDPSIAELVQLTEHSKYFDATGRFPLTLSDWHRAVDHIGTSAVDPYHNVRVSPEGDRLLIVETEAGDGGYALEITKEGTARCHLDDDEPTDWMSVSQAAFLFEDKLHNWYDLPTEWSHLNRTLACTLKTGSEKPAVPKKPWWKFWSRN